MYTFTKALYTKRKIVLGFNPPKNVGIFTFRGKCGYLLVLSPWQTISKNNVYPFRSTHIKDSKHL
jgi:hypothetical protein